MKILRLKNPGKTTRSGIRCLYTNIIQTAFIRSWPVAWSNQAGDYHSFYEVVPTNYKLIGKIPGTQCSGFGSNTEII